MRTLLPRGCRPPMERFTVSLRYVAILFLLAQASCGGGSAQSDPNSIALQEAIDNANAKESQARVLAADTPCSQTTQCGVVNFLSPVGPCANWSYKVYSIVSPTAAAAASAAQEQVNLANRALALAPPTGIACPALVAAPPMPACVAEKCL